MKTKLFLITISALKDSVVMKTIEIAAEETKSMFKYGKERPRTLNKKKLNLIQSITINSITETSYSLTLYTYCLESDTKKMADQLSIEFLRIGNKIKANANKFGELISKGWQYQSE